MLSAAPLSWLPPAELELLAEVVDEVDDDGVVIEEVLDSVVIDDVEDVEDELLELVELALAVVDEAFTVVPPQPARVRAPSAATVTARNVLVFMVSPMVFVTVVLILPCIL